MLSALLSGLCAQQHVYTSKPDIYPHCPVVCRPTPSLSMFMTCPRVVCMPAPEYIFATGVELNLKPPGPVFRWLADRVIDPMQGKAGLVKVWNTVTGAEQSLPGHQVWSCAASPAAWWYPAGLLSLRFCPIRLCMLARPYSGYSERASCDAALSMSAGPGAVAGVSGRVPLQRRPGRHHRRLEV